MAGQRRVVNRGGLVADPVAGLVHSDWGFKHVDTSELTHAIHPYPARLVPQVARKVIEAYARSGARIWDPFAGSGTVLLEAMTHGYPSLGTDLNPFACLVARAKTSVVAPARLAEMTEELVTRLRSPEAERGRLAHATTMEGFSLDVDRWWKPDVVRDLGFLRGRIQDLQDGGVEEAMADLLDVAFAWTVRRVSNQRPNEFKRYRRPKEEIEALRPDVVSLFLRRWDGVSKMVAELARRCPDAPKPRVRVADASTFRPRDPTDLIVTSPPYGDATTTVAYGQYSSLMMEWLPRLRSDWRSIDRTALGGDRAGVGERSSSETLGSVLSDIEAVDPRRAAVVEVYFSGMRRCLRNFLGALAQGAHACIIIGGRTVRGVTVPNAQVLTEDATDLGFEHVETFARRIFFKVGPYRVNPIGRTGRQQRTPAIGREQIIILRKS